MSNELLTIYKTYSKASTKKLCDIIKKIHLSRGYVGSRIIVSNLDSNNNDLVKLRNLI